MTSLSSSRPAYDSLPPSSFDNAPSLPPPPTPLDSIAAISCTAFQGTTRIAQGPLPQVALRVKQLLEHAPSGAVLIFNDATGESLDIDFRGSQTELAQRLSSAASPAALSANVAPSPRGRGRPKLGVVAREVTLLPRHWEWLNSQPGGASLALRRLVDEARRLHRGKDRQRYAQEICYRFLNRLAPLQAGYDDVVRALFAGQRARFDELLMSWPADARDYARQLATEAFGDSGALR